MSDIKVAFNGWRKREDAPALTPHVQVLSLIRAAMAVNNPAAREMPLMIRVGDLKHPDRKLDGLHLVWRVDKS